MPLDISWFGSFVNWQLVKVEQITPWITRFVKLLCSLIEHVPGDCKNWKTRFAIKESYNSERLLWNFLFFIVWLYLVWNLVEMSKMICPEQFTLPAVSFAEWLLFSLCRNVLYNRCRQISNKQKESFHFKKLTNRLSMAALASVEYRCSDLCWCYLQQTVHFFQSDPHAVILNKLAFPSLHYSISIYTLKTPIS